MKRTWRNGRGTLPVVAALTVAAASAVAITERPSLLHATPIVADTIHRTAPATPAALARLDELSDAFASVAARVKPSVVYITARHTAQPVAQRSRGSSPDMNQIPPELRPFFRDMPGLGDGPMGPNGPSAPR